MYKLIHNAIILQAFLSHYLTNHGAVNTFKVTSIWSYEQKADFAHRTFLFFSILFLTGITVCMMNISTQWLA